MPEQHGPPRPPFPIPDGKPNPHFEPHRARLAALRAELSQSSGGARAVVAAASEWESLPLQFRLFVLVFCGVDDPEDVLARGWREMPPAERQAVGACLRQLREHLGGIFVLTA